MNYPSKSRCELYENKYCTLLSRVGSLEETAGLILQFNLQIVVRTKTETRNIIGFTFNSELLTNLFNICFALAYFNKWVKGFPKFHFHFEFS